MKLSKETLTILKNFASINPNLILNSGSTLNTISTGKNIIAQAVLNNDVFPIEFGIYDLNEFLAVLTLFDNPDLEFNEKCVVISQDKNKVKYFAASTAVLTPTKTIKNFPTPDVTFNISSQILQHIQKASSILRVTDFSFIGDGATIKICIGDKKNVSSNTFNSDVGLTSRTFMSNFKVENLKLLSGDYIVEIAGNKIAKFQYASKEHSPYIVYIALEADSTMDNIND